MCLAADFADWPCSQQLVVKNIEKTILEQKLGCCGRWREIKEVGHADKKEGWLELQTLEQLCDIMTTMAWLSSAHHVSLCPMPACMPWLSLRSCRVVTSLWQIVSHHYCSGLVGGWPLQVACRRPAPAVCNKCSPCQFEHFASVRRQHTKGQLIHLCTACYASSLSNTAKNPHHAL